MSSDQDFRVNTTTADSQLDPSVTGLANGGFIVTWQSADQNHAEIRARLYHADGSPAGLDFRISTDIRGWKYAPSVTALPNGGFVATWLEDTNIRGRLFTADGVPVGNDFLINEITAGYQSTPLVTSLADGSFVVTWSTRVSNDIFDIFGRHYDADGNPAGTDFRINETSVAGYGGGPAVTGLTDSRFIVTWTSNRHLYGRFYDADGSPLGDELPFGKGADWTPSTTALANGRFVVAWSAGSTQICASLYNADGSLVGDIAMPADMGDWKSGPSVTALADGNFVMTWQSSRNGVGEFNVFGRLYDADGNPIGNEFPVNTSEGALYPSLAGLADGRFVVAWDWSSPSTGHDIRAIILTPNLPVFDGTPGDDVWRGDIVVADHISGGTGNDTLSGRGGADLIHGDDGDDTLDGGTGSDILDGGAGNDILKGGSGNDTYFVDTSGDQVIEAGGGIDTVNSSVSFSLGGQYLENLILTGGNDIDGTGNGLANTITGNDGDNTLNGLAGDDMLRGGAGQDTLDGGSGIDTADYSDKIAAVSVTLDGATSVSVMVGGVVEDTIRNIENVIGGSAGDSLTGDGGANRLAGHAGDDVLDGGAGDDVLDGGVGSDILRGGSGNDAYFVDAAGDRVIEAGGGIDTVNSSVSFSLGGQFLENLTLLGSDNIDGMGNGFANTLVGNYGNNTLIGLAGDDILQGADGNDVLRGGAGQDTLDGGAGIDTADYSDKTAAVSVTLDGATSVSVIVGGVAEDMIRNIENLLGGSNDDSLTGDSADNSLSGGAGDDTLTGGGGSDVLTGGAGRDQFVFNTPHPWVHITDFNAADDTIVLDHSVFSYFQTTGTVGYGEFHTGSNANAQSHLVYNDTTGQLMYDSNASGAGGQVFLGYLSPGLALTNKDFLIV